MMSGLRSQREYMMTCVSLRSGIASSGSAFNDHQPPTQASAAQASTRNLCCTEKSMMRLIMTEARRIRSEVMLRFFVEPALAAIGAEVIGHAITIDRIAL